jgi:ABC-2 type transport system permease protein
VKPILFLATLRDSWKSIVIFSAILFGWAIMMMLIYPTMGDMLSDPMTEGDGISLTQTGLDDMGLKTYNMTWDLTPGAGEHVAIGTANPLIYDMFAGFMDDEDLTGVTITQEMFEEAITNQSAMDLYGISVLYIGRLNYVEFSVANNESFFFVVYLAGGGNYTPVDVSPMVSDVDFSTTAMWDEWLNSPFVEGFIGRTDIDFTSPEGFMAVEFFSMWPMFFLIFIGIKSGGVVAPHVEDKSMDILLATGYSRNRFLSEKVAILAVNVVAVNVAAFLGVMAGTLIVGETMDYAALATTFAGCIPVGVAFIGIGMLLSMLLDEAMKVTWIMMGLVVGMYIIDIITNVVDETWTDILGHFSLFYYYDAVTLMVDMTIPLQNLIIPLVVGLVGIVAAFVLFKKKEIHA